jgi:metal-sulfur cluster biosynthetic enzyme
MPQRQRRCASRMQNIVTLFIYLTQKIRAGGHYPSHYNETHYCKYNETALCRTRITSPPTRISREYNLMTAYASWQYQLPLATNINNKANIPENQELNNHAPNIAACCTLLITMLTIILSYLLKHVRTNRKLEICNAIENEILKKHNIDLNCLDNIPDEYLCPILHSIITNPFILDGRAYEATAIYAWIYKYGRQTVPHTNLVISQTKQQTIMRIRGQMSQVVDPEIKQSIHTWVLSLINDIRLIQHFVKTINTSKDITCLNYEQKQDTSIEVTVSENGMQYHYYLGKYTDLNCLLQNSMRLFASEPDKRRQLRSLYAQSQQNTPAQLNQL